MATTTTWISMANSKNKKKEKDEEKKRKVPVQTETVQKPTVVVRSWQANQNHHHHQHFLQSIGQSINKLLLSHYGTQRWLSTAKKQRKDELTKSTEDDGKRKRIPNKKQKRHWKNVHPNASMNLMEKLLPVRPRRKREKRKGIGEKKLSHRRWCMQQRQTWSTVIEAAGQSREQKDRTHKLTKFSRKPICLPISFAGYNCCCCTHKHRKRKERETTVIAALPANDNAHRTVKLYTHNQCKLWICVYNRADCSDVWWAGCNCKC